MPFLGHWYILLLILAIVLIVYGPGKLPEVGGAIGRAMREFRKASTDLQEEFKQSASSTTPSTTDTSKDSRPAPSSTDAKPTDTKV
jgi:sec-independent protein translocase protein TatA